MANFPPQLASESPRAYEAFCEYCQMGVERSQEAVSQRLAKSRQILSRWSAEHSWVERVRVYDTAVAADKAEAHTKRYLADLEDHRKRASEAGKALYTVAAKLLQRLNEQAGKAPRRIEGKDGKWYDIPGIDVNSATLGVVKGALQTSLDLEAHALGLDQLLPKLQGGDDSE